MRIKFFLPDTNDLVDPYFNFSEDTYFPERRGPESDVYAHEIFDSPNFDGLLVTKSNIDAKREEKIKRAGGIHSYFRISKKYPIMGDCGAFQYIEEKEPLYTCQQICDYYSGLGFDFGISLDHVVVDFDLRYDEGASLFQMRPTEDMEFRYRITIDNAKKMKKICEAQSYKFKLIGCVQGWSPKSYLNGVKELISSGFRYIAIGGVAKAPNEVIVPILREIRETVLKNKVKLHVLGVARFNVLDEYKKSGVCSCDSSSSLFQAFKSQKDNYHGIEKSYTAVRIPAVMGNQSPKVSKLLKQYNSASAMEKKKKQLHRMEAAALKAVRDYANKQISLKRAMEELVKYEDQFVDEKKYYHLFEETLRDRPWEICPCPICKSIGVEVVILRGNDRNRRRGFHNTYVFYNKFKEITGGR
jgi:hypothetical protein